MKFHCIKFPVTPLALLIFLITFSLLFGINSPIITHSVKANTINEILPTTITQVIDSLGNVNTNSWTKGTGGDWSCSPDCPDMKLEIGETITYTVTAADPNHLPIEYKFDHMRNGSMITAQDWSSDNTFEWLVSLEDVGPWSGISVYVRNNDGQDWQGEWNGDDYNYQTYVVIDPNTSPSTITEVIDSLGNVNTNSWTKGTGGGWSCSPDCPDLAIAVGETITFTAMASDPNDLPIEYKFGYSRNGSMTTAQDWSSDNTFEWLVSIEDVGSWSGIDVFVRNNDGQDWQGEWNGDDYNYQTYVVIDPNTSPATITEVVDSLGNVNTSSWTKGTGGGWSCNPDCPDLELRVGDEVLITATATDPSNLPIEYKFDHMRNGSMTTAQDWSSDNTFEWLVSLEDVGPWSGISVHVRNNDGQDWQGEWNGDDYNYLTYKIYNKYIDEISPKSSPVGSSTINLQIEGSNFEVDSVVKFGDTNLLTTFINSSTLTASIPGNLLDETGEFEVKVIDPNSGVKITADNTEGDESNSKIFRVEYGIFLPIIQN